MCWAAGCDVIAKTVHSWETGSVFDPLYFNSGRPHNVSKLKLKDKSKVRKQVQKKIGAIPLDEYRSDKMLSLVEVDLEVDDDLGEEQHSYTCHDRGVFQQIQAEYSGTETSQEQPSMNQEYVLVLCLFEAIAKLDYERLVALPSSVIVKTSFWWVFIFNKVLVVLNTSFLWTDV